MLLLIRLHAKDTVTELRKAIESQKRNLYLDDVVPLYLIRQEGKRYLSIVLDVKSLESMLPFLHNITATTPVKKITTIPLMSPIYFPLPKDCPTGFSRFQVFLRVAPERYDDVYNNIITHDYPKYVVVTYLSYSFGDDDIIVSLLAKNKQTAADFVKNSLAKADGVLSHDISRVVRSEYLLPPDKTRTHRARFMYSQPAGKKGRYVNQDAHDKYLQENAQMTVTVRLYAGESISKLWKDVEKHLPKIESKDLVPLYASQPKNQDYISVIFEAANFEVLKDVLTKEVPSLVDIRKTRTIPMLEPTYFLMPKSHPTNLERYLISLRVDPSRFPQIRSNIIGFEFPDSVFLTYLSYVFGIDDIMLSILTDSRQSARDFAKDAFNQIEDIQSYKITNQLKTKRLTSGRRWKQHQLRYLSSYDRQHREDYDKGFDWTNDLYEYALMSGEYHSDMEH